MRRAIVGAGLVLALLFLTPSGGEQRPTSGTTTAGTGSLVAMRYVVRQYPRHHHHRHLRLLHAVASWYDDAGTHCCDVYAYYGVADCGYMGLCYPQGTRVEFYYRGRSVRAVVDDHGPYANGASWDLNQNVRAALGFSGVDEVWYRLVR